MTKTNRSPAQRAVHRHNCAIGHAVMIQRLADHIINLPTASDSAVGWAKATRNSAANIEIALRAERKK